MKSNELVFGDKLAQIFSEFDKAVGLGCTRVLDSGGWVYEKGSRPQGVLELEKAMEEELEECLREGAQDALEMMQAATEEQVIWVIPEIKWMSLAFTQMKEYLQGHLEEFDSMGLQRDSLRARVGFVVENRFIGSPLRFLVLCDDLGKALSGLKSYYVVDDLDACRQAVTPSEWEKAWAFSERVEG